MHGIGGDGEYCGDNDAQLDRINVLYHEAPSGKKRTEFSDLEPGAIGAMCTSRIGLVDHTRGKNGPKGTTKGLNTDTSTRPRSVEAHTSALITF